MISAQSNESRSEADLAQLFGVLMLMLISVAFVYSATMAMTDESASTAVWYHQLYFRQIIYFFVGAIAAVALCAVEYRTLSRWSYVIYWIAILSLILVIIPKVGTMRNGARRWIDFKFFLFQPTEFAKLAFIMAEAHFLSRPLDELRQRKVFWKAIGLMAAPFLLIMKEPDLGSAMVLVPTGFAMIYASGTPRRYLLQLLGIGGILAALLIGDNLFAPPRYRIGLHDYQVKRLMVYFGVKDYYSSSSSTTPAERHSPQETQSESSYNVRQALIAVGSGGIFGKGWRQGQQNSLGFLPEAGKHNDFIFSVIAEEEGFVGGMVILGLYFIILFTGIRTAGQARDRLGKLLAVGVVTLIFSHVFINIGMNIRIMPVAGVPLPLISYGGSSVLGSLIAMGLLQNVHIYRKAY